MSLQDWDWKAQFGGLHIRWHSPQPYMKLDGEAAYKAVVTALQLDQLMQVWGYRVEPTCFSSNHLRVGDGEARHVPAIAVMVAGLKHPDGVAPPGRDPLQHIPLGGGAIVQALVHGETGEILIGLAVPVELNPRH